MNADSINIYIIFPIRILYMIGEEKKICSIVGKLKKKRSVKFIGQEGRKSDRHAPAPIFRYAHV